MTIQDNIENDNVLNIYQYGSHVYGNVTEHSDTDYILVVNEYFDNPSPSIQIYTKSQFQLALNNCEITALECFYLNESCILKETIKFEFKVDLNKLRISLSTISNNSYVKCKKKLIISGDYEPYTAIKSMFHSLRILDFGIQILTEGKIINYGSMNWLFYELLGLMNLYQRDELWQIIDTRYRELFKKKKSEFKRLAPLDKFNQEVLNKWMKNNFNISITQAQYQNFLDKIVKPYFEN